MPFKMGSPFSPEMLSLIEQKNARLDRRKESRRNDLFKYAQLRAEVDVGNRERRLRSQIENARNAMQSSRDKNSFALAQQQMENAQRELDMDAEIARGREERLGEQHESEMDLRGRAANLAEGQFGLKERAFEAEQARLPVEDQFTARGLKATEDRTRVMSEAEQRRRFVEFGPDGTPSLTAEGLAIGSRQEGRAARTGKDKATTDFYKKRAEELGHRIEGTLPPTWAEKQRIKLGREAAKLAVRAQNAETAGDAIKLVSRLFFEFKDAWDNTPPDAEQITAIRDSIQKLSSGFEKLMEDAEVPEAVIKKYVDEYRAKMQAAIQEQNVRLREARRAGEAPTPTPNGEPSDSVVKQAEALFSTGK